MPLPEPTPNEQQPDFMSRCMSHATMMSEFPDQKQRLAVCYRQFNQMHKQGSTFRYLARVHSPFEFQGKWFAKIRIIDTSTSLPSEPKGERWRPTYEALKRALKSLLHMPLVSTPAEGHSGTELQGTPVSYSMPDGYADVTFEIKSRQAWEGIKSGKWVHVSPEVLATKTHQEGDVAVLDDFAFQRVAFVDSGAFPNAVVQQVWEADMIHKLGAELIQSHTLSPEGRGVLIDGAASTLIGPQAADQIMNRRGDDSTTENQSFIGASAWDTADCPDHYFAYVPAEAKGPNGNKSLRKFPLASVEKKTYDEAIVRNALARFPQANLPADAKAEVLARIRSVAKDLGITVSGEQSGEGILAEEKNQPASDQANKDMELLKTEVTRLQGELVKAQQQIALHDKEEPFRSLKAAHDRLDKEVKELREYRASQETAVKTALVNEVLDLRIEAGFSDSKDRADELVKFSKFDAAALKAMADDATAFILQSESSGPKAQFKAAKENDLESSVRARMGLQIVEAKK